MDNFEFIVSKDSIDSTGMATVPSICRRIAYAIRRNFDGKGRLTGSTLEISSRPREDEMYNILLRNAGQDGKEFWKKVILTDQEGYEFGHGVFSWKAASSKTAGADKLIFLDKFYSMLPEDVASTGLSVRIDMDFLEDSCSEDSIVCNVSRENQDKYLFDAKCCGTAVCSASLVTE
ncbi:MAG: hypothetical protein KBS78_03610 [Bacteroidales bacterium]|nr:hypothetical protein [Candidatus Cryptobacteroides faecihippi]